MNRLLTCALFGFMLLLPFKAEAEDVYMGNNEDDYEIYLISETLFIERHMNFTVQVKAVSQGELVKYIDYGFGWSAGKPPHFRNSEGKVAVIVDSLTPVEMNILEYAEGVWTRKVLKKE